MSKQIGFSDDLAAYLDVHSTQPDPVQAALIERTAALGGASMMQIGPHQGAFLEVIVGALAPSFAIEIGTFTGYSAISIARGLAPGGTLLCCDVSEEWTSIAREHWAQAGLEDRIELRIAPAIDTLADLDSDRSVDFAFIDADKTGYAAYYEALLPRLSPDGVIAVDNTLWNGRIIESSDTSRDTEALRAFNAMVAADERVIVALTPIGDGLTLIRRR